MRKRKGNGNWEYKGNPVSGNKIKNLNLSLEKKHNTSLEKLADNPGLIGILGEVMLEAEIDLYNSYEKIGCMDLFIRNPSEKTVYYIEYKCFDSKNNQKCAKKQLLKAFNFISEKYHDKRRVLLYVYENFKVLELTTEGWKVFP